MINEELVQALADQNEFNVIVKPHPYLLSPKRCQGKNWKLILEDLKNNHFLPILDRNAPIYKYMPIADILLSDISSVIYEFLFLDRPIVVHVNQMVLDEYEGQEYFNEIRPVVFFFQNAIDMIKALNEANKSPLVLSAERKRILEDRFFNIGSATECAVKQIYNLLLL